MGGRESRRPAFMPHVRLYSVFLNGSLILFFPSTPILAVLCDSRIEMPSFSLLEIAVVATSV